MFNDFKSPTVVSNRNGLSKEMNQDAGNEESEACDVTGGQEVALGWKELLGGFCRGAGCREDPLGLCFLGAGPITPYHIHLEFSCKSP